MTDVNDQFRINLVRRELVAAAEVYGLYETAFIMGRVHPDEEGTFSVTYHALLPPRSEDLSVDVHAPGKELCLVRCAFCGTEIGAISVVLGTQVVGCRQCRAQTRVDIYQDGHINTSLYVAT